MERGRVDFRERLEQQATRLGETARQAAVSETGQKAESGARRAIASAPMQQAGESFRGFRWMLADDKQTIGIETYLLTLVRAVRSDEREVGQTGPPARAVVDRRRSRASGGSHAREAFGRRTPWSQASRSLRCRSPGNVVETRDRQSPLGISPTQLEEHGYDGEEFG